MSTLEKIVDAFSIEKVNETYTGHVRITDLKEELGTKGHVLVIRGDLNRFGGHKYWQTKVLLESSRIQEQLRDSENPVIFDGVGLLAYEALAGFSLEYGYRPEVVMAREILPTLFKRSKKARFVSSKGTVHAQYSDKVVDAEICGAPITIIPTDGKGEEGYVKKQREVLKSRYDIIYLNQALYGSKAMAQVGNKVVDLLNKKGIKPNYSSWVCASGSSLYGIGGKIKQNFPDCKTIVTDVASADALEGLAPDVHMDELSKQSIDEKINHFPLQEIKRIAKQKIKNYFPKGKEWVYHGVFPIHKHSASPYLLMNWMATGEVPFDAIVKIEQSEINATRNYIKKINKEYDWSDTTNLALAPVIEMARQGKNVVVMAYARYRPIIGTQSIEKRNHMKRDIFFEDLPRTRDKVVAVSALITYLIAGSYVFYDTLVNKTPFFSGFSV
jgi:hypothetical protein